MNLAKMKVFLSLVFLLIKFFWPIKVILVEWTEGRNVFPVELLKQCYFYENFFAKNKEAMKKYLTTCTAREGITYSFDNGQIITFQDNFKYLADVPFTVYFDFETTTGDSVFFNSEMFVVSYCQIYSFHPSINLDKIVIYCSFQQTADKIYDLSHLKREQILFFNKTTFHQLKDAASAVLAR